MHRHLLLFLFLICSAALAGQIAIVQGRVIDAKTRRPLAGATISLGNDDVTKTSTDSSGKFEISIAEYKNETIYVSLEGYRFLEKSEPQTQRNPHHQFRTDKLLHQTERN